MIRLGRSGIIRSCLCTSAISLGLVLFTFYRPNLSHPWSLLSVHHHDDPLPPYEAHLERDTHPIDELIRRAQADHQQVLQRQPQTVEEAAADYRLRRGRHPPPGFDQWYEGAKKRNAVVVEDFFDQIQDDLNPFWALEAKDLRIKANRRLQVIRVRNHVASFETDNKERVPWIQLWHGLIREAAAYLPDVDVPVNFMDETRVLVPWEEISRRHEVEQSTRRITPPANTSSTYTGLGSLDAMGGALYDPKWINDAHRYWDHARNCCPPESPARQVGALNDFAEPIVFPTGWPPYSEKGYVQNWTEATSPCSQPHLRAMHGTFIESISMSTTHELIPMFGGSKLSVNNDILLPGAMYLSKAERYSGGELTKYAWSAKASSLLWRGVASGGRVKAKNWHHFHRHRFVQAVNGTAVAELEAGRLGPHAFALPNQGLYDVPAMERGNLSLWLDSFSDVAMVHLGCFPAEFEKGTKNRLRTCSYTDPYFAVGPFMDMEDMFQAKFLPDVDGNSFSGRYRAFLLSRSLPIKATIYREWHDRRLMPWVHFVPMDNSFMDVYGLMAYFLAADSSTLSPSNSSSANSSDPNTTLSQVRDLAARRIAEEGRAWAERVLRREDMLLYMWRLLLEWARVCDDQRDWLGYVDDLIPVMGQRVEEGF